MSISWLLWISLCWFEMRRRCCVGDYVQEMREIVARCCFCSAHHVAFLLTCRAWILIHVGSVDFNPHGMNGREKDLDGDRQTSDVLDETDVPGQIDDVRMKSL